MEFSTYTVILWMIGVATGATMYKLQHNIVLLALALVGYVASVIILAYIYMATK